MPELTKASVYKTAPQSLNWFKKRFSSIAFYFFIMKFMLTKAPYIKNHTYPDSEFLQDTLNILKNFESVGVRFHIENLNIPRSMNGPCIYVANHMSTMETFILSTMILPYSKMTFVVKQSLLNYPVFKHFLRDRNPIAVTRENPKEDFRTVINEGKKRIQENVSVIVFPQTTRSLDVSLAQFNTIGVKLAQRTGVPVVPVALKTDAWGNGKWVKDFGKIDPAKTVHIKFGNPVTINDNRREIHEQIKHFIRSNLIKWIGPQ